MSSSSPSHSTSSTDSDEKITKERNQLFRGAANVFASLISSSMTPTSSRSGPRSYVYRNREAAHERLVNDYFSENAVYDEEVFRRRFRMSRRLFERIVNALEAEYEYFQLRWDHRGKKGFSPIQKCTAALRQLAYGVGSDALDDYLKMSERTSRECMQNFCEGIVYLYGQQYLRKPTFDDIQKLYVAHESQHGFVGMIGSIDCTHWSWANCPVAWRGQYMRGDHEHPTLILQAIASHDLWIWQAFFGASGANNDINVLNSSPLVNDIAEGRTNVCSFQVNGVHYKHGYYLADGIYPEWSIFVKSFTCPQDDKRKKFKSAQESARKDVERAFGVLKQRWHILHNPARPWSPAKLRNMMYACIILHNMIIEDEGNAICSVYPNNFVPEIIQPQISEEQRAANVREIHDQEIHNNLRSDLVEHIATIV